MGVGQVLCGSLDLDEGQASLEPAGLLRIRGRGENASMGSKLEELVVTICI